MKLIIKLIFGFIVSFGLIQMVTAQNTLPQKVSNPKRHTSGSVKESKKKHSGVKHHTTKCKSKSCKKSYHQPWHSADYMEGVASHYASKFSGRRTTTGHRLNMNNFTAAHPTVPMGTKLKVTNLRNGKTVYVVVNDRMPKKSGFVIDLTNIGARKIGIYGGTGHVKLARVDSVEFERHMDEQINGVDRYQNESGLTVHKNLAAESENNSSTISDVYSN